MEMWQKTKKWMERMPQMKNDELFRQCKIVRYLRDKPELIVFSVPNGIHIKNISTRNLMKSAGLLAGVSDLIIVSEGRVSFVEIKGLEGQLQPSQKEFKAKVEVMGYEYLVWRTKEEAQQWYANRGFLKFSE